MTTPEPNPTQPEERGELGGFLAALLPDERAEFNRLVDREGMSVQDAMEKMIQEIFVE